ncbi:MAG: hypothetical protein JO022_15615 [Acidobacteriaceae bacterium]|nr:hypothetical protein [Acidobacteriaceae bacterium]
MISIAALPDARWRGLAQALIAKTVAHLRAARNREFAFELRTKNREATELYRKLRVRRLRRTRDYYRAGIDRCLCFNKPLPAVDVCAI